MDVSEIVDKLGNPGRYHFIFFICMFLCSSTTSINHLLMVVFKYTPEYTCNRETSNIAAFNSTFNSTAFNSTFNSTTKSNSKCPCTNGWTFNFKGKESSIVSEWSLVCDDKYLVNTATTVYFTGVMVGGALFGQIADKIGRKPVVLICMYGHILLAVGVYFVKSYVGFVSLRFFIGVLVQGLQTSSYVLLIEMTMTKYRPICAGIFEIFWAVGNLWMAIIAWLVQDWRLIQLALCLPSLITLFYIILIPESPRWLLTKGRVKQAQYHLRKAAAFNGVTLPDDLELKTSLSAKKRDGGEYSFHDLFRTPKMRKRTLLMAYVWLASSIGYYGVNLSVASLAGNRFLNLFISAFVEVIAFISVVFILKYLRRRPPLIIYYLCGGVLCIIAGIIKYHVNNDNAELISTVLALTGKFFVAAAFSTIFLFTVELFPTVVRSIGMGSCVFWARVGGMIAPQINLTKNFTWFKALPFLVFGLLSILAALAIYFVPETSGAKLLETIEELEGTSTYGEKKENEEASEMNQLAKDVEL